MPYVVDVEKYDPVDHWINQLPVDVDVRAQYDHIKEKIADNKNKFKENERIQLPLLRTIESLPLSFDSRDDIQNETYMPKYGLTNDTPDDLIDRTALRL